MNKKLHFFRQAIDEIELPDKFTYPFHYVPHALCLLATHEVQDYLEQQPAWKDELQQGKMFGVLVVKNQADEIGYLAAFSGNLAHSNQHEFFVPPVYDLLQPEGFFKIEEEKISEINHRIQNLSQANSYLESIAKYEQCKKMAETDLSQAKEKLKIAKRKREELRNMNPTEAERLTMIRESQFQKAEYKRLEKRWKEKLTHCESIISTFTNEIQLLKQERKIRSAALQIKLFKQFRLLNARGEIKDLCELFAPTSQQVPPAGAGECAAPKLLQYAFLHRLQPIAMAEFWWGDSPKTELRKHGYFYPACKGKCSPILAFMLQGLSVEENPLSKDDYTTNTALEIIYEDTDLLVINKPAGMLSVPGKEKRGSVYDILKKKYPDATGPLVVHRLDMATSGLLLIAKRKEIHQHLQAQFKNRTVKKRYVAWLDGIISSDKGTINLPICLDPLDRPRQMVSREHGKPAVTNYEVLRRTSGHTLIAFYPQTGRTHQLRVHSAHTEGLNAPITGDELYGKRADRLYLHAEYLEFIHPISGKIIGVRKDAPFYSAY